MADIFTKKKRSLIMAAIRNKNTKPEILIRKALFKEGFRYRINNKKLLGSPDIVLAKYQTVIFIHGCFWHGHSCKKATIPKTNSNFWLQKVSKNKVRDRLNKIKLKRAGWKVIEVWQCDLSSQSKQFETIEKLISKIKD